MSTLPLPSPTCNIPLVLEQEWRSSQLGDTGIRARLRRKSIDDRAISSQTALCCPGKYISHNRCSFSILAGLHPNWRSLRRRMVMLMKSNGSRFHYSSDYLGAWKSMEEYHRNSIFFSFVFFFQIPLSNQLSFIISCPTHKKILQDH